jgi:hypothetical protein
MTSTTDDLLVGVRNANLSAVVGGGLKHREEVPALAPVIRLPARLAAALARGLTVTVTVGTAETVRIRATVPARQLGKRGKPIVVATATGHVTKAGKLTIRLRQRDRTPTVSA